MPGGRLELLVADICQRAHVGACTPQRQLTAEFSATICKYGAVISIRLQFCEYTGDTHVITVLEESSTSNLVPGSGGVHAEAHITERLAALDQSRVTDRLRARLDVEAVCARVTTVGSAVGARSDDGREHKR